MLQTLHNKKLLKTNTQQRLREVAGTTEACKVWSQNSLVPILALPLSTGHLLNSLRPSFFFQRRQVTSTEEVMVKRWCVHPLQFLVYGKWSMSSGKGHDWDPGGAVPWNHWGCSVFYLHLTRPWSGWRQHHSHCKDRNRLLKRIMLGIKKNGLEGPKIKVLL